MHTQRGQVAPADLQAAERFLAEALLVWQVRSALAGLGLRSAVAALQAPGEVLVEFDPGLRLLTVELWEGGRRVFGIDDLV